MTSVSVVSLVWVQIYAPYYGIAQEYLQACRHHHGVVADRRSEDGDLRADHRQHLAVDRLLDADVHRRASPTCRARCSMPRASTAPRAGGSPSMSSCRCSRRPRSRCCCSASIGTLQTFPIVHLMTGGGPNRASEVFGTYIFKQSFVLGDTGAGAALSVIVLVIALVLSLIQIADPRRAGCRPPGEARHDGDARSQSHPLASSSIPCSSSCSAFGWCRRSTCSRSACSTPAQAFDAALFTWPVTFDNFVTVIRDNPLGGIFLNSLIITVATVAIVVAVVIALRLRLRDSAAKGLDVALHDPADHADGAARLDGAAARYPAARPSAG